MFVERTSSGCRSSSHGDCFLPLHGLYASEHQGHETQSFEQVELEREFQQTKFDSASHSAARIGFVRLKLFVGVLTRERLRL